MVDEQDRRLALARVLGAAHEFSVVLATLAHGRREVKHRDRDVTLFYGCGR
jgi:hypothetical protein